MAVKELETRCWVLDYPAGAPDDGRHFGGRKRAEDSACSPYEGQVTGRELAAPCHVIVCDTADCGAELENMDDGWTIHIDNPADEHNMAVAHDWTLEGEQIICYFCPMDDDEITAVAK